LIPGGKVGVWIASGLGFLVVLLGIVLSFVPPGGTANKFVFEAELIGATGLAVLIGLLLHYLGTGDKPPSHDTAGREPGA
jgi:hypothetical protein